MQPTLLAPAIAGIAVASSALGADTNMQTDEVRALVAEMIADAESRSSLLQSGGTAGHDGKFFLASADGNFRLNVSGQVQFRYMLNFRDDEGGVTDDFVPGFQTRRTKLTFAGDAFGDFFYKVNGAFSRSTGAFGLEDAYVGIDLGDGWKARWGQFKEGFMREELVSSSRQLFADRSMVNEEFNQGRSQGIEFSYAADDWRFFGSFSDGFGSANTALGASPADWSFTARGEWLLSGDWKQFKDFTSGRGSEEAMMLGGALHYEMGPDIGGADEQTILSYTGDFSWEGDGWNAFAAFVGRHIEDAGGVSGADFDTFGYVLQGGWYISDDWELIARWDQFLNDSDAGPGDDFSTISFGANHYIHGHAAKFTIDAQLYLDDIAGTGGQITANEGIGYLGNGAEEDEFVIRAQFQLLF